MKQFYVLCLLLAPWVPSMSQSFDSSLVIKKLHQQLRAKQEALPASIMLKETSASIENRVDFSSKGFDFTRSEDQAYLKEKSRKVFIVKFADIRHTGCDIYVQNASTKFPLSNLELHSDATGKVTRDLPLDDIAAAMKLYQSASVLPLTQAAALFQQHTKTGKAYAYANILIDLPTGQIRWQFRGAPNWQSHQQELMEIDAINGTVVSQQQKSMNITNATVAE